MNKVNGKRYIGSTINFRKRKNTHLSNLRTKTHHSPKLQNAWNKYGEEAFEFLILEEVKDGVNLLEREQWWITETPSQYNVCLIAGNCSGRTVSDITKAKIAYYNIHNRKFSKETKKKISESKKGIKRDSAKWKNKKPAKKCYEYNENGIFVKEWLSIKDASVFYNLKLSTLWNSIQKNKYIKKYKIKFTLNKTQNVQPYFNLKHKVIHQFDLNMNFVKEWKSIDDAIKFHNCKSNSTITNCLTGRAKTAIGYIWKYKN
jgi:group I intron endonuclease